MQRSYSEPCWCWGHSKLRTSDLIEISRWTIAGKASKWWWNRRRTQIICRIDEENRWRSSHDDGSVGNRHESRIFTNILLWSQHYIVEDCRGFSNRESWDWSKSQIYRNWTSKCCGFSLNDVGVGKLRENHENDEWKCCDFAVSLIQQRGNIDIDENLRILRIDWYSTRAIRRSGDAASDLRNLVGTPKMRCIGKSWIRIIEKIPLAKKHKKWEFLAM